MRLFPSLFILIFVFSSFSAIAELRVRPSQWATPIIGSELDNLYQVDSHLFRSEQPDEEDFDALASFGIQEVLNLREYHSDKNEVAELKLDLTLHHLRLRTSKVTQKDIIKALAIIKKSKKPILVHCWHGSDRTGAVVAAYRIIFNQWSKIQAIDELVNGGYGYHARVYPNIIHLIDSLDIDAIKKALK